MARLEARAPPGFGSTYAERQEVRSLIAAVEPLLRNSADHEIDTDRPVSRVVDDVLKVS